MESAKKFNTPNDFELNGTDAFKNKIRDVIGTQSASAATLCNTNLIGDYILQFVVLSDLAGEVSGARLDVPDLIAEVAKICPSILDKFAWDSKYKALDLMRRIIYNIGPETRNVKKGKNADSQWRLRIAEEISEEQIQKLDEFDFESITTNGNLTDVEIAGNARRRAEVLAAWTKYAEGPVKITTGMFVISTFKSTPAPTTQPKLTENSNVILLTIKQATIVGLYILSKFTKIACTKDHDILTPLSGAVFSRDSLAKMMATQVLFDAFKEKSVLIDAINKSAQNGGQFLDGSRADVAAVCVLIGTMNVKKPEERRSIVQRTLKQYLAQKRPADKAVFEVLITFGTGGLPQEWTFESLMSSQETSRRVTPALRNALQEAVVGQPEN